MHEEVLYVREVAIGPYHRKHGTFTISTEKKWQIVHCMGRWFGFDWRQYFLAILSQEISFRLSYQPEPYEMGKEEFMEMLLLDSCFIVFVFIFLGSNRLADKILYRHDQRSKDENDLRDSEIRWIIHYLMRNEERIKLDLLIYDNQIPHSVLKVLSATNLRSFIECQVEELALSFFNDMLPKRDRGKRTIQQYPTFIHLLDLFHWSRTPEHRYKRNLQFLRRMEPLPSASELKSSGITFKKKCSTSSLIITFRQITMNMAGIMYLPGLDNSIYHNFIFHTLVLFEQNQRRYQQENREIGYCISSYIACMSLLLMRTKKDAYLLRKRGILADVHNSDSEVVEFFKNMSSRIECELPNDVYDLFRKVREHHGRKWNWRYLKFKFLYRPSTWIIFSAAFMSLCSVVQIIYAVLGYHFPKN